MGPSLLVLDSLASLLAVAALLLAAYGLGWPIVRAVRLDADDLLAGSVWSVAIGLLAGTLFLVALGLAGCLYPALIGIITLTAASWGCGQIYERWRRERDSTVPRTVDENERPAIKPPPRWLVTSALCLAAGVCLATLVEALAPPTDGDALCYHLELPKVFLAEHRLVFRPYDDTSTFPLVMEVGYLWALALEGGVAAQLLHWATGVLLALATTLLAADLVGRRWACVAGSAVLLVPGVGNQMGAALNDLGLALWTTLALVAWRRAAVDDAGFRWYALAGAMLGAAWGTKYTGLVFTAALAGAWLGWSLPRREQRWEMARGAAVVLLASMAVGGIWYARAAWYRGNPVYPFFARQFGQQAPDALPERKTPLAWHPRDLARAPWELTMHPERFGGRGHQLGAMFLVALPGLLVARRLRGLGLLLAVVVLYAIFWYALRQNLRFLLPVVPLLATALVWVGMELARLPRRPAALAAAVLVGLALFQAAIPAARAWERAGVAVGLVGREEYLLNHEPCYEAAREANRRLGGRARILSQDYRAFYFQAPVVREGVFRRQTRYHKRVEEPGELAEVLRQAGFTHLLLAEAAGPGIRFNPRLARLVADYEQAAGALACLADYEFRDADGALRRYRLLELPASRSN